MQVSVHWQDADSSSAKVFREVFPDAEIMICGGHAGREHKKMLEKKTVTEKVIEATFPALGDLSCKCTGYHSSQCGCLTVAFISKAHTNLMEAQSQEGRLEALPKHARDVHEWEGGRCDFHPLRVCTCQKCSNQEEIKCEGKP